MKSRSTAALLFVLAVYTLTAQDFVIGKFDTLHSKILNEERTLLVHVPSNGRQTSVRYPVLYLLDGDAHFTKTVGIIDHLSNTAGNELCPQMIVVAVFHPNRERDLIPPGDTTQDKFAGFLEKELLPYIDARYPTQPYRVLVGHSLGGLRVVNTVLYQPRLFNSYLALDPSLGMVKNWIGSATKKLDENSYSQQSLYIAMGMTMPRGTDTAAIVKDTSGQARHMRCIMTFARHAAARQKKGLDFNWNYYPEETHQSVVFKGTYEGLISNFSWFKNEKLFDIFKNETSAAAAVKIITDYYTFLSGKMGYTQVAPEQGTSDLISYLFFKHWYDKALAFAELNYANYPSSPLTKSQLQAAKWNSKKSIATLYPKLSAQQIYRLVKREQSKKETDYNISEDAINTFGYALLQQNKLVDAELVFKLNVELYPNSYNVYDSYGECLLSLKKETEGLLAYKKSLELHPGNSNARNVLAKYGQGVR